MSEKNKKVLTIEDLKQYFSANYFLWYFFLFCVMGLFGASFFALYYYRNDFSELGFLIISPIVFMILSLFFIIYFIKRIKNQQNIKKFISNSNFKIVEDEIYDKHVESDGDGGFNYRIWSKIYGEISTSKEMYAAAKKDDLIYILFCDNQETNNIVDDSENKRNSKLIVYSFLISQYDLSFELSEKVLPYNKTLGKSNYESRIKKQIMELEKKKSHVKCKKCGNTYKLNKYDVCPNCSSKYKFDIIDVMHEKKWYK